MSDATNTTNAQPGGAPPSAEPPKQTLMQKATQWAGIGLAVVLLLIGAAKIYNWLVPSLPGCTDQVTTDTVRGIFKSKNVQVDTLNDMKLVSETKDERTCSAHIDTPTETGSIGYKINWQDKEARITITAVDVKPR